MKNGVGRLIIHSIIDEQALNKLEKPLSERSIKSLCHACIGARDTEGFSGQRTLWHIPCSIKTTLESHKTMHHDYPRVGKQAAEWIFSMFWVLCRSAVIKGSSQFP